jgi:transposase
LERECQRNVELIWLAQELWPDFKTIADFRRGQWTSDPERVPRLVALCRNLHLRDNARFAIDGSKFKAVNNREKNFRRQRL